jgi:hypothetical protein
MTSLIQQYRKLVSDDPIHSLERGIELFLKTIRIAHFPTSLVYNQDTTWSLTADLTEAYWSTTDTNANCDQMLFQVPITLPYGKYELKQVVFNYQITSNLTVGMDFTLYIRGSANMIDIQANGTVVGPTSLGQYNRSSTLTPTTKIIYDNAKGDEIFIAIGDGDQVAGGHFRFTGVELIFDRIAEVE